jgi:Transcription factor WhiB
MTAAENDSLTGGACLDLPLAVVDKYFMADPRHEYFQYLTAKAICGRCAVRAACLAEAIVLPPTEGGIRGGESAGAIRRMHRRLATGQVPAETLAAEAVLHQPTLGGIADSRMLRRGRFPDVERIDE